MKFRVRTHTLDNNMKPIESSKQVYNIGEFKDIDEYVFIRISLRDYVSFKNNSIFIQCSLNNNASVTFSH